MMRSLVGGAPNTFCGEVGQSEMELRRTFG